MCFDESFGRSFGWIWGYFVTYFQGSNGPGWENGGSLWKIVEELSFLIF